MKRILMSFAMLLSVVVAVAETWNDDKDITWTYSLGSGCELTGTSANAGELVVPSLVNGQKVTSLGKQFLKETNKGIVSVVIPESVTVIGQDAFRYCSTIQLIELPSKLERMESQRLPNPNSSGVLLVTRQQTPVPFSVSLEYGGKGTAYVPFGTLDSYQAANGWKSLTLKECHPVSTRLADGTKVVGIVTNEADKECAIGKNPGFGGSTFFAAVQDNTTGIVVVPAEVEGYTVTEIGESFSYFDFIAASYGNYEYSRYSSITIPSIVKAIAKGAFNYTDVEKIFVNVTDAEAIESICSTDLGLTSNDEHKDAVIYVPNSCYELYKSKLKYRKVMPQATDWQDEGVVVVNNATAGQLRLEMAMLDEDDVHLLKVTGKVNADDLSYLRSGQGRVAHLEQLDLSEVTLVYNSSNPYVDASDDFGTFYLKGYLSEQESFDEKVTGSSMFAEMSIVHATIRGHSLGGLFYKSSIQRVALPKNIDRIDHYLFRDSEIMKVRLGQSLKSVGSSAFRGCKLLETIDLTGVEEIGQGAFYQCEMLESVGDLSCLKTIPVMAFYGCERLVGATATTGLDLSAVDTIRENAFIECCKLKSVVFGNRLKAIGNKAFAFCKSLTSITLPEGLERIADEYIGSSTDGSFYGCEQLATVVVPSTLLHVDANSFSLTPFFTSIPVVDGVKYIGTVALTIDNSYLSTAKPLTVRDGTTAIASNFLWKGGDNSNGKNLTGVNFPTTLRLIGRNAFKGATLTALQLPEGLQYIGEEAFCNAVGGTSLTIPESVTEIGSGAFSGSTKLLRLTYNSTMRHDVTDFDGHDGIFSRCTALERVTIGSKVSCLPPDMFYNCTGLLIVNSEERSKDATLNLGWGAFRSCSNLMRMSLPETTDSIYWYSFSGCSSLQNFYLPSSVRYIGQNAFDGMSLPDDFDLPSNLRCLDDQALQGVTNLTTLTFPAHLDYIGSEVFDAKAKYTRFTSLNKNPKDISEYATRYVYQVPLYVPYGTVERYKACVGWKDFTNIIEMEPVAEPGDVNQDGAVDIADVVAVYNIMAGNNQNGFDGDVNNDGATDIADVVAIYNIMAGAAN